MCRSGKRRIIIYDRQRNFLRKLRGLEPWCLIFVAITIGQNRWYPIVIA